MFRYHAKWLTASALVIAGWLIGPAAQGQQAATVIVQAIKPADAATPKFRTWATYYGLTWEDLDRIKKIDGVTAALALRIFPQEVSHEDKKSKEVKKSNARLVGTTEDYAKFHDAPLAAGRFLQDKVDQVDEGDDQRFRTVVVLGAKVAEELFPNGNAVGQSIVLNKEQYVVVGVVRNRQPRTSGANKAVEDYNRDVYIPIKTCQVRFGDRVILRQGDKRYGEQVELHEIHLAVRQGRAEAVARVVRELLGKHHEKKDWDVSVR